MRVGPYEVEGELGRGGMGVVYRARATDGRPVAVKILGRTPSPIERERFERERRILASFGAADGFVPLLDAGEERGHPYLVMPLLDGGTLRRRLEAGALPIGKTIALAEALALALSKAHERGVVHRDLKPENILYDLSDRPHVADLGLAKHFETDAPGASASVGLSRANQMMGTVGYMAPEQARDARSAGPPADVFALGAILYECLAGWPAFEGANILEVLDKVERVAPPPLANARPETPVWLARLVERALSGDPALRYPDGGALLAAIRARESGVSVRGGIRVTGWPWKRALVAAPALVASAVLALVLLQGSRTPEGAVHEAPSSGAGPARAAAALTPEQRLAAAQALLEGPAPVTSASAPVELLEGASPAAAALRGLAARRAIAYAPADVERLRSRFPGDRDASVLWAIPALGGPPEVRALAESTLDEARERDLARRLLDAARFVDEFLERGFTELAAGRRAAVSLVDLLRFLARAPRESVDLAVAPLSDAMVAHGIAVEERKRVTMKLLESIGFDDADVRSRFFPPRLLRAWSVMDTALSRTSMVSRARAAESVAAETSDAIVRLAATSQATFSLFWLWERGYLEDRDELDRVGASVDVLRAELEASRPLPASVSAAANGSRRGLALFRLIEGRKGRASELARGIALGREALVANPADDPAARDLLRFRLEQGERDRASLLRIIQDLPATTSTPTGRLLEAEVLRVSGDAQGAIDHMTEDGRSENGTVYMHAALALAWVQLGRLDDARRELKEIPFSRDFPPLLTRFSREAVQRAIAEREKR